tara:strand:- start:68 stop:238 length:171 start_codon:yes stop_codon:yes gene_type:complete
MAKGAWKRLKCKIKMMCCCRLDCIKENNISIYNNGAGSKTNFRNDKTEKEEKKVVE